MFRTLVAYATMTPTQLALLGLATAVSAAQAATATDAPLEVWYPQLAAAMAELYAALDDSLPT